MEYLPWYPCGYSYGSLLELPDGHGIRLSGLGARICTDSFYNLAGVFGLIIAAIRGRATGRDAACRRFRRVSHLGPEANSLYWCNDPDCAVGGHGSGGVADAEIIAPVWLLAGALWSLFALPSFSAEEVG